MHKFLHTSPMRSSTMRLTHALASNASVNSTSQKKHILITGGNTGIGYETAKALLNPRNNVKITLACRDQDKGTAAKSKLLATHPSLRDDDIQLAVFDLANLQSISTWANKNLESNGTYDVILCNAGVMACPKMETKDGFEYQLGVNHLGHFLLTNMLLPLVNTQGGRIISVASAIHLLPGTTINFDDLQSTKEYDPWKAYAQSKLANVLFAYELSRRVATTGITVNALHPGVVATELGRYLLPDSQDSAPWWSTALVSFAKNFALTPEQGAKTSVYLASSAEVAGVTGKYFDNCKPTTSSKVSYDADMARRLWDVSSELVGL